MVHYKKMAIFVAIAIFSISSFAHAYTPSFPWTKDSNNPLISGSCFGSVVYKDGVYHAYVRDHNPGGDNWMKYYTSTDGINFTYQGYVTSVDVVTAYAWYENGKVYILSSRVTGDHREGYLFVNTTGHLWDDFELANNGYSVIKTNNWNNGTSEPWGVIKYNGTYYVYCNDVGSASVRSIGVCWTTDSPDNWTNSSFTWDPTNPQWTDGRFCNDVYYINGSFYSIIPHYTSGHDYSEMEVYKGSSPKFHSENRTYVGVAFHYGSGGEWDSTDTDTPFILTDTIEKNSWNATNNKIWCYYAGTDSSSGWGDFGLAYGEQINGSEPQPSANDTENFGYFYSITYNNESSPPSQPSMNDTESFGYFYRILYSNATNNSSGFIISHSPDYFYIAVSLMVFFPIFGIFMYKRRAR